MKKIIISRKSTNEEKLKSYKKAARHLSEATSKYKASVISNKKRKYDKKDKSYKTGENDI